MMNNIMTLDLGRCKSVVGLDQRDTAGEAWKFTHRKRQTARDDAQRLAELEVLG